mgnify:CR=1 FL=1
MKSKFIILISFLLIPVSLLLIFSYLPLANIIYYSLTSWDGLGQTKEFVGLSNYIEVFKNPDYFTVFKTSIYPKDNFDTMMKSKIDFIQPKSLDEKYFLYNLNIPFSTFAKSLNNVIGVKEYNSTEKEDLAILQFKTFFSSLKNEILENKLQLTHNIKTKKNKI